MEPKAPQTPNGLFPLNIFWLSTVTTVTPDGGEAMLYVTENGGKWRALPKEFGPWHTIYTRIRRWADNDVWPRMLEALKTKLIIEIDITALSLDSTSVKVHPDGMGPLKKTASNRSAKVAAVGTRRVLQV